MKGVNWVTNNQWLLIVTLAIYIGIICSMMCCQKMMREFPTNYIVLFAITVCLSVIVGFSSALYTWQSVLLAAGITCAIFIAMTIYAWTTSTDFTGAGPYLFAAMMCMSLFGLVICILGTCGVQCEMIIMMYDFL